MGARDDWAGDLQVYGYGEVSEPGFRDDRGVVKNLGLKAGNIARYSDESKVNLDCLVNMIAERG